MINEEWEVILSKIYQLVEMDTHVGASAGQNELRVMLKRLQNFTNQPFDALNVVSLLYCTANFLIYFSSVNSLFLIFS